MGIPDKVWEVTLLFARGKGMGNVDAHDKRRSPECDMGDGTLPRGRRSQFCVDVWECSTWPETERGYGLRITWWVDHKTTNLKYDLNLGRFELVNKLSLKPDKQYCVIVNYGRCAVSYRPGNPASKCCPNPMLIQFSHCSNRPGSRPASPLSWSGPVIGQFQRHLTKRGPNVNALQCLEFNPWGGT